MGAAVPPQLTGTHLGLWHPDIPPVCARSPLSPQHQPLHPEVSQWDTDGGGGHGDRGGDKLCVGQGVQGGLGARMGSPRAQAAPNPPLTP